MTREFRCERCHHLLFKGSLKLLMTKRHPSASEGLEVKCTKCGLINCLYYQPETEVMKQTSSKSLFDA